MPQATFSFDPNGLLGRLDRSKEQIIPGHDSKYWLEFHLAFYRYAEVRARGDVLDIGCGYGYGSHFLSAKAKSVTGIDYHPPAIAYAAERYQAPNLKFLQHDANNRLPFEDASFDLVVSSEVLEHIRSQRELLLEIDRVGRRGGYAIIKTPHALNDPKNLNPHHQHVFGLEEYRELMTSIFPGAEIYFWVQESAVRHQVIDLPIEHETRSFGEPIPSDKAVLLYTLTTPKVLKTSDSDGRGADLLAVCPFRAQGPLAGSIGFGLT
jgi:SAM-dependent methyltransferase